MNNLKRLGATAVLTLAFGLTTLASEAPTAPCAPPDLGQTSTPPCSAAQTTSYGSAASGQTETLPASNGGTEYSITDLALSLVESMLVL